MNISLGFVLKPRCVESGFLKALNGLLGAVETLNYAENIFTFLSLMAVGAATCEYF